MKTSTKAIKSVPSFHNGSRAIVAAQAATDKTTSKRLQEIKDAEDALITIRETAFGQFIDACHVSGMVKNEASCKAIQVEVKNAFVDEVAVGIYQQATINNYAMGAMRAFYHAEKWTTRAFQAVDKGGIPALPWSKRATVSTDTGTDTAKSAKSGKVSKTTVPALVETLRKALEQAKLLNLDLVHAIVLDACIEIDGDFKV